MPELPEVETIVRTLRPQACGRRIQSLRVLLPKAVQAGADKIPLLAGGEIEDISRRAKLLLMGVRPLQQAAPAGIPEKLILAFHLKMTGSFFVHPPGTTPLKHTRLVFDLGEAGLLFFDDTRTFGYCRVMLPEELSAWSFWAGLGPEPLELSAADLAAHFAGAFANRRTAVKAALLDQGVVAGIGNIYADESLFRAGIAPDAKAMTIPLPRLLALAEGLQAVLRQSIEECGSSIRDYRDANGNAGAFQNSFAVYGRKGEECRSCGRSLAFCKIGGRATVYCPACQKKDL